MEDGPRGKAENAFSGTGMEWSLFAREWKPESDVNLRTNVRQLGPGDFEVTLAITATARLEEWAGRCAKGGCRRISVEGKPWVEILAVVEREEIDLICMASHGRGGVKGLLVGSVAERVLHRASCPVLIIRPEGPAWKPE